MESPPETLDGAGVLQFASLARSQPSGKTGHGAGGVEASLVEASLFAAVAIARYEDDASNVYLFYCDRSWNVVTDTSHEDVAAAIAQANFEFGLLRFERSRPERLAARVFRNVT
jgi:hypothetical protein